MVKPITKKKAPLLLRAAKNPRAAGRLARIKLKSNIQRIVSNNPKKIMAILGEKLINKIKTGKSPTEIMKLLQQNLTKVQFGKITAVILTGLTASERKIFAIKNPLKDSFYYLHPDTSLEDKIVAGVVLAAVGALILKVVWPSGKIKRPPELGP